MRKSVDNGATWTGQTTGGITGFNHMSLVTVGGLVSGYAIAAELEKEVSASC